MAYVKQTWVDNETLINAEKLNHIEDGIEAAGGEAPIEKITVNNVEQAIVDKTVNLEIDRAEVDEEEKTLIVGDITGGGGTIECIKVNGTALAIEDNTVDISVPTKTSELNNDAGYVDSSALSGYAKESDLQDVRDDAGIAIASASDALEKAEEAQASIPTKVSELTNDAEYITATLDGETLRLA